MSIGESIYRLFSFFGQSNPRGSTSVSAQNSVSDDRFWMQLTQVRTLKLFLFQESVSFKEEDLPKIGLESLDAIRFNIFGRSPTVDEWSLLDAKQSALSSYLDIRLRWKLRLSRMRKYYTTLPVVFLFGSVFALALGSYQSIFRDRLGQETTLVLYSAAVVLWNLALAGLGACAFLGTTMISETARMNTNVRAGNVTAGVPPDSDFDLSDRDLIWTRVVVGILFGFLLGLPLSAGSLTFVEEQIIAGDIRNTKINSELAQNITMILLPFVFGFSTTLVLGIMERLMSAIRAMFGIGGK